MAGCDRVPDNWFSKLNPDITGPGALLAFFITATITIAAVLLAYLSDSLDKKILSGADRMIVAGVQRFLKYVKIKIGLRVVESDSRYKSIHERSKSRDARVNAFTSFILLLSDQQLVTGWAISLAVFANIQTVTGVELSAGVGLTWFSTTTHLATLDALQKHFQRAGVTRNIRVVAMLSILVLVAYGFSLLWTLDDDRLPVRCSLESSSTGDGVSYRNPLDLLVFCLYILMFVCYLWLYLIRIGALYLGQRQPLYLITALLWRLGWARTTDISHAQFMKEREATIRAQHARRMRTYAGPRRLLYTVSHALYLYHESFLSSLPSLVFSYIFGIQETITGRLNVFSSLASRDSQIGFGSLMALLLLALPFLAAADTYFGCQRTSRASRCADDNDRLAKSLCRSASNPELRVAHGPSREIEVQKGPCNDVNAAQLGKTETNFSEMDPSDDEAAEPRVKVLLEGKPMPLGEAVAVENVENQIPLASIIGIFLLQLTLVVVVLVCRVRAETLVMYGAVIVVAFAWFTMLLVMRLWEACKLWSDVRRMSLPHNNFPHLTSS